ncbi:MAG: hypothetical protein B7Z66_15500, partial [Chromatiales bacterium 21-64-14]
MNAGSDEAVSSIPTSAPLRELLKATPLIQAKQNLTLQQRKMYNILLYRAYPRLGIDPIHTLRVSQLCKDLEYRSRNIREIKEDFEALKNTRVEANIFGRDGTWKEWEAFEALAYARVTADGVCQYAFPPNLIPRIKNPRLYARLKLSVSNAFGSRHAHSAWEYFVDALDTRRKERLQVVMSLDELKVLLNLSTSAYPQFRDFSKRVLTPMVREINAYSDLAVCVEKIREGRAVQTIGFDVQRKVPLLDPPAVQLADPQALPPEEPALDDTIRKRLAHFGFRARSIERLVSQYPSDYIAAHLDIAEEKVRRGAIHTSVTGFIVKGLDLDLRGAGTTPIEEQLQQQVHAAKATALQAAQQEAIEQAERGGRLRARNSALEARLAALT